MNLVQIVQAVDSVILLHLGLPLFFGYLFYAVLMPKLHSVLLLSSYNLKLVVLLRIRNFFVLCPMKCQDLPYIFFIHPELS